jgi:hypothetical protein
MLLGISDSLFVPPAREAAAPGAVGSRPRGTAFAARLAVLGDTMAESGGLMLSCRRRWSWRCR